MVNIVFLYYLSKDPDLTTKVNGARMFNLQVGQGVEANLGTSLFVVLVIL